MARYSLRSHAKDMGTVSSRTRSRSSGVTLQELSSPTIPSRKRVKVKIEPVDSVDCSNDSVSNVAIPAAAAAAALPVQVHQIKVEPPASSPTIVTTFCDRQQQQQQQQQVLLLPVSSKAESPTLDSSKGTIEFSASSISAARSRSSSPIFLEAVPPKSPLILTMSSSSLSSASSEESVPLKKSSSSSRCSSFHLFSASPAPSNSPPRDTSFSFRTSRPPLPRRRSSFRSASPSPPRSRVSFHSPSSSPPRSRMSFRSCSPLPQRPPRRPRPPRPRRNNNNMTLPPHRYNNVNDVPSGSTVKVWDVQNGRHVIRELPLVASQQTRNEHRGSTSAQRGGGGSNRNPYNYTKNYYKKPFIPRWNRDNRGSGGRGRCPW